MASTSSRRSCFSRRPPRPPVLPGGGSSGSMIAHWASVVAEEGYTAQRGSPDRRSRPGVPWVGQGAQVQVGEDDTRTPGRWWRRHLPAYQESPRPRRRTQFPDTFSEAALGAGRARYPSAPHSGTHGSVPTTVPRDGLQAVSFARRTSRKERAAIQRVEPSRTEASTLEGWPTSPEAR